MNQQWPGNDIGYFPISAALGKAPTAGASSRTFPARPAGYSGSLLPIWQTHALAAPEITVAALYVNYAQAKSDHRSIGEIRRIFERHILPDLGWRSVQSIDRTDVTLLLDKVARLEQRRTPVMARAVAAQLSAYFSWAIARLPNLGDNPCRLASRPPKPRSRSRVLSDGEVQALWLVLDQEARPWSVAIKLILLTGQRRGEVFDASWNEFDLERSIWTIPAERSKNGREHEVPLSAAAVDLIRGLGPASAGKLFPSRTNPQRSASGFSKAMARITRAVAAVTGRPAHFTLQDLRRTVATRLQALGVRLEVTEAVLNHISGSRGGIVGVYQLYQFEAEKRAALDRWAAELEKIVQIDAIDQQS
ncbi:MAG: site-specific integrase [Sphingomonas sp.]|nr:site-specific integrase [Sphingomonas sp.]